MSLNTKIMFMLIILVTLCTVNKARNLDNTSDDRTNINNIDSCKLVKPFFEMRNISISVNNKQNGGQHHHRVGNTCNGQCCDDKVEGTLRLNVQQEFASLLRHNSRSLQGLLSTTATTLHDHIMELTSQSENQTLHLFSQVYKRMSILSRDPIKQLYTDIKKYLQISETDAVTFATSNLDIKISVNKFFTDLFPLVYHHAINTHQSDFSFEYKLCLKRTINELQPFGDIPRQIAQSAFKSLEATRVLLQAFAVGVEILNATDTLLIEENIAAGKTTEENSCHQALLKMTYCPKCRGLITHTKPCSGYCLNVLRGCLTQHVTELDSPWNDYVEAIERLVIAVKQHNVGVNVDTVIRSLDGKISNAIMYAMENGPSLEKKVKLACGHAKLSDKEDSLINTDDAFNKLQDDSGRSSPERLSSSLRTTPPDTQLLQFLASVVKSRGFYATLADNLCKDDSFAETRDGRECWNGQRIGEYTETVVDASLSMQKYNPEVRPNNLATSGQIARLADKLRHVRQVVVSALGTAGFPESDSYMQGDASEGSGSGIPKYSSDDSDDDNLEGSGGSGDHHPGKQHPDHRGAPKKKPDLGGKPKLAPSPPEHPVGASSQLSIHNHSIYLSIFVILFTSAWFG